MLYARKNEKNEFQTLTDHLNNVASLSASFAKNFVSITSLAGKLHDIGKATQTFQEYLKADNKAKGSVVHSLQGAFSLSDLPIGEHPVFYTMVIELLQMVIASHHGKLPNAVDLDGGKTFFDKMLLKNNEKYSYNEVSDYLKNIDISKLFNQSTAEIQNLFQKIKTVYTKRESVLFAFGLFVKYIYSCLIDADRLDAHLYETKNTYSSPLVDWKYLINIFEQNISAFKNDSSINKIRAEISEKCKNASDKDTGIYRLSIPTGGGKTLSSLRFALHHALKKEKTRIIYVIPYLSITTQTTQAIRNILDLNNNSDTVLEHYSNIIKDETQEEESLRKLATARWGNPIIITTMVQFLESIMSSQAGGLRKFHNMENSVIIFDEIQSLPINCIHLFNETASFLSKVLDSTILLCSATQPIIEQTERKNLLLSQNPDLIEDYRKYEKVLKRTNIIASNEEKTIDSFSGFVFEKAKENGNCLCIVNLKSQAKKVYKNISALNDNKEFTVVHLSTSMCGQHRGKKLKEVIKLLNQKKQVICVSTQLIEAGVDISFACVVRAMAGLDSILQAAGRCNRNGEYADFKNVYTYPIKDEKGLEKLKSIEMGKANTQRIIRDHPNADYMDESILKNFYNYYLERFKGQMDYLAKGTSVYSMLSENKQGTNSYQGRTGKPYPHFFSQAFATADESFSVIPNHSKTVVVYFGQSEKLLNEFKDAAAKGEIKPILKILNKLQEYTISLFDHEYQQLDEKKAIILFDEQFGVYALNSQYYSGEYGLDLDSQMQITVV